MGANVRRPPPPVTTSKSNAYVGPAWHHYVPQGYLAAFTSTGVKKSGRLCVYRRDTTDAPAWRAPREVAAEPQLYVRARPGERPTPALEHHLAREVERPFLAWHRKVLAAPRGTAAGLLDAMTRAERTAVGRFIAFQQLRTPAHRLLSARLAELTEEDHFAAPAVRRALEAKYYEIVRPRARYVRPEARAYRVQRFIEAMRNVAHGRVTGLRDRWLWPIERYADGLAPRYTETLAWRLVESPPDVVRSHPFVTCDNPIVFARPRTFPATTTECRDTGPKGAGWDVELGGGWSAAGLQITFTLSPRHALLLARDRDDLALADDPRVFAEAVRVRTARHALAEVYAREPDDALAALVRATPAPDVAFVVAGVRYGPGADVRDVVRHAAQTGGAVDIRYGA